jgi:hypothetical protein
LIARDEGGGEGLGDLANFRGLRSFGDSSDGGVWTSLAALDRAVFLLKALGDTIIPFVGVDSFEGVVIADTATLFIMSSAMPAETMQQTQQLLFLPLTELNQKSTQES